MDSMGSSTGTSAISPAVHQTKVAAAAGDGVEFDGMVFAVTEGNEVAEVLDGGARSVLPSESYVDDGATRHHFVDVQGGKESMLLVVSVSEDECRIVGIRRFC